MIIMSNLRFYFLFILLFFLIPCLLCANDIPPDRYEEIPGRGFEINTEPHRAKVFVDGVERGLTPLKLDNLIPGVYQIILQKEGYYERNFNIVLTDTRRLVVSMYMAEMFGTVNVTVTGEDGQLPENPQLTYSGKPDDETVLITSDLIENENHAASAELTLHAGFRTITARAFGWEDQTVTVLVEDNKTAELHITMKKAAFKINNITINRRRLNPNNYRNLGEIEFRYEVSAPGEGRFNVINSDGATIYTGDFRKYSEWLQKEKWNGRDYEGNPVPEGIYTILVEADGTLGETDSIQTEIEVSYSTGIFPMSLESGISGLMFSPLPNALPLRSHQLGISMLFGKFLVQNDDKENVNTFGFPFKISARIALFKRTEITAVFNLNPHPGYKLGWGLSGSLKYNFVSAEKMPVSFAGVISYAWADENGDYPLSPGKGVGVHLPLAFEVKQFSITFSPAVFWRGPEGAVPEVLVSGGALYRGGMINAGLSYRCEINMESENIAKSLKHLAGAEIHITLLNFVISAHGGLWAKNGFIGGFGGIGIGTIF